MSLGVLLACYEVSVQVWILVGFAKGRPSRVTITYRTHCVNLSIFILGWASQSISGPCIVHARLVFTGQPVPLQLLKNNQPFSVVDLPAGTCSVATEEQQAALTRLAVAQLGRQGLLGGQQDPGQSHAESRTEFSTVTKLR